MGEGQRLLACAESERSQGRTGLRRDRCRGRGRECRTVVLGGIAGFASGHVLKWSGVTTRRLAGGVAVFVLVLPGLCCDSTRVRADGAATSVIRGGDTVGIWQGRSFRSSLSLSEAVFVVLGG